MSSRLLLVVSACLALALVSFAGSGEAAGSGSDGALQPTTFAELTAESAADQRPGRVSQVIQDALSEDFSEAGMRAKFNELKAKRRTPYVSAATEEKAFRAFYKNRLKVRELNAQYSKPGQKLFTSSGKFADMDAEEFAAKYLNYRTPPQLPKAPATAAPSVFKNSKVKNPEAGGKTQPAKVPIATKSTPKSNSATRVRNPAAGGKSREQTPGSVSAKKSPTTKTSKSTTSKSTGGQSASPSSASKKLNNLKSKTTKTSTPTKTSAKKTSTKKSNAKTALLEVETETEAEAEAEAEAEVTDGVPCGATDKNGVVGVLRDNNTNLDDCAKAQGWEDAWADMTRAPVDGMWCCIPAKQSEVAAKCAARGGKCVSNNRAAGNVCEGNEGKFHNTWEGHCPPAAGFTSRNWCCIGAKEPPPEPKKNGCADEVNGVRGVLVAKGTGLNDCAKAQGWKAAWADQTRDKVEGSWCCVPSTPEFIIKNCVSKGGLCGTNKREKGNTCEGNGGKFVAEWDGFCPDGTSVADGPSATAWCCVGGKPETPGPKPDAKGDTYLIDYRAATGKTTPVKNQSKCGSCWAHAAIQTLEAAAIWAGKPAQLLSPQALMDCRKTPAEDSCKGGWFTEAFDQWKSKDSVLLSQYPYTMANNGWNSCKAPAGEGPRVKSWGYANPPCRGGTCEGLDEEQLLTSLKNYGSIAVTIHAGGFQYYKGGIMPAAACNRTLNTLNHAVSLVGYGLDKDQNKFWLVRNSWGADWGEQGYLRMEFGKNTCGIASTSAFVTV